MNKRGNGERMKTNGNVLLAVGCVAVSLLLSLGEAFAETVTEYPKLKDGEWEISVQNMNLPKGVPANLANIKSLYCIDSATQDSMIAQSQDQKSCAKPVISRSGDTYLTEVSCNVGGVSTQSRIETTLSGDSEITSKITMTSNKLPPTSMTSTGRWIGPCREGRKPGDIVILNGPGGQGDIEKLKKMSEELSRQHGR